MQWKIIAVIVSVIPLIIAALLLDITFDDLAKIGVMPFILASIFAIAKLFMQGLRFHYYLKSFVGNVSSIKKEVEVRMGSEFVTLTTPAYTGGEFVRLAWLHKNGIHAGKGMWIITIEVISDVLVGSILSYIAAIYALLTQNYLIGLMIIIVVTPILAVYMTLLALSSKKIIQLPKFTSKLLRKIVGEDKSKRWIDNANDALKVLCSTSRDNLRHTSLKIFVVGFSLTLLGFLFYASALVVLTNAELGIFESLLTVAASIAVGTIPITPGGSGLTEFGMGYYLNVFDLNPAEFGGAIIAWRIATYHVLLATSWSLLMHVTMKRKISR
ncbi:MAG: hypothetical protein KatS3mg003_1813 [Candidatus Nitrosocaldaceae archaeon]|nr:MAG: hypothetical protein KatS3mg003_1813 [Candidatus Nitrosocaldaceae archaeon]